MIEKYIALNRSLRGLQANTRELMDAHFHEGEGFATASLAGVLVRCLSDLERLWPAGIDASAIGEIRELITTNDYQALWKVVEELIPKLEDAIDDYFSAQPYSDLSYSILDLLHPRVVASSYAHFKAGHFREAVLNSVVTIFDFIRERTGLDKDGSELVAETFSLQRPFLVLSTLDTESGRNDQKGFIQMLQGVYQGVRNPKAHTLTMNPSQNVAAQYLVFSSLLCRRVEESTLAERDGQPAATAVSANAPPLAP